MSRRILAVSLACIAVLATLSGCARPQRLLCIVPEVMPDGSPSADERAEFEDWLVDEAGGFTRFDSVEGAWQAPDGTVVREANHLYFVTAPAGHRGFEKRLRERIVDDFDQQEAWVERR